jgi:endonuclease YncB( thermonuclease family)
MAALLAKGAFAGEYRAKVVKVVAGDTLVVKFLGPAPPPNPSSKAKLSNVVRLRFSDAPEIKRGSSRPGQPFGKAAKEFMKRLLPAGSEIRVVTEDGRERGTYNRTRGVIFKGSTNVNVALIDEGFAHVFPYPSMNRITCKTYREFMPYAGAETFARKAGTGIWSKNGGLEESPHNYRRRISGMRSTNIPLGQYSDAVRKRVETLTASCGD